MPDNTLQPVLDELRELLNKLPHGDWKYHAAQSPIGPGIFIRNGFCVASLMMGDDLDEDWPEQASKTGPFIAAARNHLAEILDALTEAQAEIERLREDCRLWGRLFLDAIRGGGQVTVGKKWYALRRLMRDSESEIWTVTDYVTQERIGEYASPLDALREIEEHEKKGATDANATH